jgi:SAM-dependent methyltransferase
MLVMQSARDPYDAFAYPAFSNPHTHPDRLAVMATLHGLSPAPIARCRVLEIGCNEGANLIPMAYAIPQGEFVGFDLAQTPVARGQERIAALGLKNVRIFAGDLLDAGPELGKFDYIIAHGLYSWIPEAARDRLLALCGDRLEPDGVAFVSYNALPGSHLRRMLRDMMLFRVKDIENPAQREAESIKFLHLVASTRPEHDEFRALIEMQLRRMEARQPGVTFHDELSAAYHPVYFTAFVEHAHRHGLQYLSDAELPPPPDPCYRLDLQSEIESAAGEDFLRREQALDFFRMRMFRETLLCNADRKLRREIAPDQLRRMLFASQVTSKRSEETGALVFQLPSGIKMESNHPAANALLSQLEKVWPGAIAFDELEPRLAEVGFVLDDAGAALLTRLAISKMIELRTWKAPVAAGISDRPRATACSRLEGRTRRQATTLLHLTINLEDPKVRFFHQLLDGTRTRSLLIEAMKAEFPETPAEELAAGIEPGLRMFHIAGALEA